MAAFNTAAIFTMFFVLSSSSAAVSSIAIDFKPGVPGFTIDSEGQVNSVVSGSQAQHNGVMTGMFCKLIGDRPCSASLLRQLARGPANFTGVFANSPRLLHPLIFWPAPVTTTPLLGINPWLAVNVTSVPIAPAQASPVPEVLKTKMDSIGLYWKKFENTALFRYVVTPLLAVLGLVLASWSWKFVKVHCNVDEVPLLELFGYGPVTVFYDDEQLEELCHQTPPAHICVLGKTGAGKSELLNALAESPGAFRASWAIQSVTASTEHRTVVVDTTQNGQTAHTPVKLIDTPGADDAAGDDFHYATMLTSLRGLKQLNSILLVINYHNPRLDKSLLNLLRKLANDFGADLFNHLALVFTHYVDEVDDEVARREGLRREWTREIQRQCQTHVNFPIYFLDSTMALKSYEDIQEEKYKGDDEAVGRAAAWTRHKADSTKELKQILQTAADKARQKKIFVTAMLGLPQVKPWNIFTDVWYVDVPLPQSARVPLQIDNGLLNFTEVEFNPSPDLSWLQFDKDSWTLKEKSVQWFDKNVAFIDLRVSNKGASTNTRVSFRDCKLAHMDKDKAQYLVAINDELEELVDSLPYDLRDDEVRVELETCAEQIVKDVSDPSLRAELIKKQVEKYLIRYKNLNAVAQRNSDEADELKREAAEHSDQMYERYGCCACCLLFAQRNPCSCAAFVCVMGPLIIVLIWAWLVMLTRPPCPEGRTFLKGQCIKCDVGYTMTKTGQCLRCDRGQVLVNEQCIQCAGNQIVTDDGNCECQPGMALYDGQCYHCMGGSYLREDGTCACEEGYERVGFYDHCKEEETRSSSCALQ